MGDKKKKKESMIKKEKHMSDVTDNCMSVRNNQRCTAKACGRVAVTYSTQHCRRRQSGSDQVDFIARRFAAGRRTGNERSERCKQRGTRR